MFKQLAQSCRYSTRPLCRVSASSPVPSFASACLRPHVFSKSPPFPARGFSTSLLRYSDSKATEGATKASPSSLPTAPQEKMQLDPLEPRLSLTFTCRAGECTERSTHTFTKRSYERGIVIVQCPGCKNRHLIADHLGWFKESTEEGKLRTIEDLLRARGEKVRRGRLDAGGVVEYTE